MTFQSNTDEGLRPSDETTEVAEAMAEALDAIHQILVLLRRDARLADGERDAFDQHLSKIEEITCWADPDEKRKTRRSAT